MNAVCTGCEFEGIRRRGGFLYLGHCKISEIRLRRPNDADPEGTNPEGIRRDISEIAPEELPHGMLEILGQIFTVDKNSLYRSTSETVWCNPLREKRHRMHGADTAAARAGKRRNR